LQSRSVDQALREIGAFSTFNREYNSLLHAGGPGTSEGSTGEIAGGAGLWRARTHRTVPRDPRFGCGGDEVYTVGGPSLLQSGSVQVMMRPSAA